jgi:hypothetical protein
MHDNLLSPKVYDSDERQLDEALRDIVSQVFEETLRQKVNDIDVYGMPHLGRFEVVERFVKRDGLTLLRIDDEERMRYLFKAWKVKNPKRGLHFLRTFLQLLYPNEWAADQMWQEKDKPYPHYLKTTNEIKGQQTRYWQTSRVQVSISDLAETGEYLLRVLPALRSVLGAKFVLMIAIMRRFVNSADSGIGLYGVANLSALDMRTVDMVLPPLANGLQLANIAQHAHVHYIQMELNK